MKVIIELDDALLRNAVQTQLGAEIARISAPMLEKVAQDVIQKKLERFNPMMLAERDLSDQVKEVTRQQIERYLGTGYQTRSKVEELAKVVMKELLKDHLK